MWTITLLGIIGFGVFLYFKKQQRQDADHYYEQHRNIFEAHERLGYPPLTKEQQFDILDNENMQPVAALTQYTFVPTGLLNHYLTIEPDEYLEHLQVLNPIQTMRFAPTNLTDGFYINPTDDGYEYLFVERGGISFRKAFSTYDKLLRYLVYERLIRHAPITYKSRLTKQYYA